MDQFAAKLHEGPVRHAIEPMLEGHIDPSFTIQDLDYVRELGLVASDAPLRIASPIFCEIVHRGIKSVLHSPLATVPGGKS